MLFKINPLKIIFLCLLFTLGCDYTGLGEKPSSPELTSRYFFEAIYVHRDVNKAKEYVSDDIWKVLKHYHIASAVQKYVFNLSMSDVTIEITDVDADFFRKFTSTTKVVVKLTGIKNHRTWIDSRKVKINKDKNGKWVIYELVTEKPR